MRRFLAAAFVLFALPAVADEAFTYSAGNGYTDSDGRIMVRAYGKDPAFVTSLTTATTLAEVIAAPAATESIYISDVVVSASGATTVTADQQNLLKYGTGSNCATGTTLLFGAQGAALATTPVQFSQPLKVPAGKAVCFINAAAGTKIVSISYFVAP